MTNSPIYKTKQKKLISLPIENQCKWRTWASFHKISFTWTESCLRTFNICTNEQHTELPFLYVFPSKRHNIFQNYLGRTLQEQGTILHLNVKEPLASLHFSKMLCFLNGGKLRKSNKYTGSLCSMWDLYIAPARKRKHIQM